MSQEHCECPKCGKECKDKRGLSVHIKKCRENKPCVCTACNEQFSKHSNLVLHLTRCKIIKQQNLEKQIIENEEKTKLLSEQEICNKHLQEKLIEIEQSYQKQLIERESKYQDLLSKKEKDDKSYQLNLKEMQDRYEQKISELKISHSIDVKQQINLRENDLLLINHDLEKATESLKVKDEKIEEMTKTIDELKVEKRELLALYTRERQKDTTTIIQNNDNRVQMQCFEPSMIQGKIDPPSYVIGSVNDLMNMLRSLGVRNTYRVNDKSRGTLSWNKPDEGEKYDPTGDQLIEHIIDSLCDDLIKERSYYEEKLKRLNDSEETDLYQINETHAFVTFCNQLLKKDPGILKKVKKELIKQGKQKGDTKIDEASKITYTKFISTITVALFPKVYEWIEMTLYQLGQYLGTKIKDHYRIEGASRESLYIVIQADDDYSERIESKQLIYLIKEAATLYIDDELVEQLLSELVLENKSINTTKAEQMLNYFKNQCLE